ncbi:MAG: N-(5'-phosphoribosyl)anthranilate isomerase [Bacteroidetes bacterium GWB2_41_8]|nr:MAG: N-(5'-phosphoribosyl)anthranilate isomerase [Bacteroidetes bacterium GWB2_41_8]
MNELKIKVCGMRDPENVSGVVAARPNFIGFIFYPKSKRFVGFEPMPEILDIIPDSVKKVGVFVDETPEKVLDIYRNWKLDVVQLHGHETPDYCRQIQSSGITVFKAFSVDESFDFTILEAYSTVCDYFLFDTKGQLPGGTGQKFNWQLLDNYNGDVPFFLSGGIGPDDLEAIRNFELPRWRGIDINSGFEIIPALKDVIKVKNFIAEVRK